MRAVVDIESNGLLDTITKIWCVVVQDVDTRDVYTFVKDDYFQEFSPDEVPNIKGAKQYKLSEFQEWSKKLTWWIGHNFVNYDSRAIQKILGFDVPFNNIVDTMILSQMYKPTLEGKHSLKAWGNRLGHPKTEYDKWDEFTPEMLNYCINDVQLNVKVFDWLWHRLSKFSKRSIQLEHHTRRYLDVMEDNGFHFDLPYAHQVYAEIKPQADDIEQQVRADFPPVKKYSKARMYPRYTKKGELYATIKKAIDVKPYDIKKDEEGREYYAFYTWQSFDITSPKQIVERMYSAGWEPIVFKKPTKKVQALIRAKKIKEEDVKTQPELCEENFDTLPDDCPDSAKRIVKWLTLNARCKKLEECFRVLGADGNIHGRVIGPGAATHRMTHRSPNQANLAKVKIIETEVDTEEECVRITNELKAKNPENQIVGKPKLKKGKWFSKVMVFGKEYDYQSEMRRCFIPRKPGRKIVGVDLAGIQLRALAHYTNNQAMIAQILDSDIHIYNQNILQKICNKITEGTALATSINPTRDNAKTFIYAYLLGTGAEKTGNILGFPKAYRMVMGKQIKQHFANEITGLDDFLNQRKNDAKRGFMVALDGRLIMVPSLHLSMGIYLQSFEAILMKYAIYKAVNKIKEEGLDALLVAIVHDESQWDVAEEHAERVGKLVIECMEEAGRYYKVNMPITGEYKIGNNWAESH